MSDEIRASQTVALSQESDQHAQAQVASAHSDPEAERNAWNQIVSAVSGLSEEARPRVISSALTFLGFAELGPAPARGSTAPQVNSPNSGQNSFSEDRTPSPKEFMLEKKPVTDIERIVCLAYYLTHYRGKPEFNALDLSKLNTEAAQIKFSNASVAVNNAAAAGFLVQAGKGDKQISSHGEVYVQALPDRDGARAAVAHARPRRKSRRASPNDDETKDTSPKNR